MLQDRRLPSPGCRKKSASVQDRSTVCRTQALGFLSFDPVARLYLAPARVYIQEIQQRLSIRQSARGILYYSYPENYRAQFISNYNEGRQFEPGSFTDRTFVLTKEMQKDYAAHYVISAYVI